MRKYLLSLLLLAVVMLTASATDRPAAQMRKAAVKSLNATKAKCVLNKPMLSVYSDGSRFSIVSSDDRFPAVLAYGCGNFDADRLPANVKWWLESVQRNMEHAVRTNAPRRAGKTYTPIEPLLTTKWGQTTPYNNYCPVFEADNAKAPCGCVATAMGQIINYQQYPASASFEGSYTIDGDTKTVSVNTDYSYPYKIAYGYYLPDGYTSTDDFAKMSYTPSQGNKVAALLRDCGYAVDMNYNPSGSGSSSYEVGPALVDKFGYPEESVKFYDRYYYTEEEWLDILHSELENNSPVFYAGASEQSGGHAFVFHGMDADGLAYVNWGWQGQYDGYYAVGMLTPGSDNFSDAYETMVTGIRPVALSTDGIQSIFATDVPYEFSYDNDTQELTLSLKEALYNMSYRDFAGRWCLVFENVDVPESVEYIDLLDEGDVVEAFSGFRAQSVKLGPITFEPSDAGTYRLYMATQDADETAWQYVRTEGGAFYYEITISGDGKMTVAEAPTYTVGAALSSTAIHEVRQPVTVPSSAVRYYDLNGREVDASAKGLVIRRQGNNVQKIFK